MKSSHYVMIIAFLIIPITFVFANVPETTGIDDLSLETSNEKSQCQKEAEEKICPRKTGLTNTEYLLSCAKLQEEIEKTQKDCEENEAEVDAIAEKAKEVVSEVDTLRDNTEMTLDDTNAKISDFDQTQAAFNVAEKMSEEIHQNADEAEINSLMATELANQGYTEAAEDYQKVADYQLEKAKLAKKDLDSFNEGIIDGTLYDNIKGVLPVLNEDLEVVLPSQQYVNADLQSLADNGELYVAHTVFSGAPSDLIGDISERDIEILAKNKYAELPPAVKNRIGRGEATLEDIQHAMAIDTTIVNRTATKNLKKSNGTSLTDETLREAQYSGIDTNGDFIKQSDRDFWNDPANASYIENLKEFTRQEFDGTLAEEYGIKNVVKVPTADHYYNPDAASPDWKNDGKYLATLAGGKSYETHQFRDLDNYTSPQPEITPEISTAIANVEDFNATIDLSENISVDKNGNLAVAIGENEYLSFITATEGTGVVQQEVRVATVTTVDRQGRETTAPLTYRTSTVSNPQTKINSVDARTQLAVAGIGVNAGESRTSLNNIKQGTIDVALSLKDRCGCDLVVTGGTETNAGHSSGHINGDKLDFRSKNEGGALTEYIKQNFDKQAYTFGETYKDPVTGAIFVLEDAGGNNEHWDVNATSAKAPTRAGSGDYAQPSYANNENGSGSNSSNSNSGFSGSSGGSGGGMSGMIQNLASGLLNSIGSLISQGMTGGGGNPFAPQAPNPGADLPACPPKKIICPSGPFSCRMETDQERMQRCTTGMLDFSDTAKQGTDLISGILQNIMGGDASSGLFGKLSGAIGGGLGDIFGSGGGMIGNLFNSIFSRAGEALGSLFSGGFGGGGGGGTSPFVGSDGYAEGTYNTYSEGSYVIHLDDVESDLTVTALRAEETITNEYRFRGTLSRDLADRRDNLSFSEISEKFGSTIENELLLDLDCDGGIDDALEFSTPYRAVLPRSGGTEVLLSEYMEVPRSGLHCFAFAVDINDDLEETNENNNASVWREFIPGFGGDIEDLPSDTSLPVFTFEVKVTDDSGNNVTDWQTGDVSIESDEELAFRWNAPDYDSCLPFIFPADYIFDEDALSTDRDTEAEQIDVRELSRTYAVQCRLGDDTRVEMVGVGIK